MRWVPGAVAIPSTRWNWSTRSAVTVRWCRAEVAGAGMPPRFAGSSGRARSLTCWRPAFTGCPLPRRELLEVMACLGGQVDVDVLRVAGGRSAATLDEDLVAPLEDGLLVYEQDGPPAVRFRHDRVQEAAHSRLATDLQRELHLTVARRLAASAGLGMIAAEQYLQVSDALAAPGVADPGERRAAAELFVSAASMLTVLNPPSADRYLTAAMALLSDARRPGVAVGDPLLIAAQRQQHSVLYRMGRLTEADAVYELIAQHCDDPTELVEPACIQVASLSNRAQPRAALDLGLTLLRRLGVDVPEDITADVVQRYGEVTRWAAATARDADLTQPESSDPATRLTAVLLNGLCATAYFLEPAIMAWLLLESLRLWTDHGPNSALVATLGSAPPSTILMNNGYRTGYEISKHALSVGAARGYEPGTSFARHCFSLLAAPWFEPLEDSVHQSQLAREGLIRGGDLQMACFTYQTSPPALLDSAPTLDSCAVDVDAALAFATRTALPLRAGDVVCAALLFVARRAVVRTTGGQRPPVTTCPRGADPRRRPADGLLHLPDLAPSVTGLRTNLGQLRRRRRRSTCLRYPNRQRPCQHAIPPDPANPAGAARKTRAWGSFGDEEFDEDAHLASLGGNNQPVAFFHVYRALSAALFGNTPDLIRHATAAKGVLGHIVGFYPTALAHLLQGLALAERIRGADPVERPGLLAELDVCLMWLNARAADAPGNFGHLATLLTAERAWVNGDLALAAQSFDAARRDVRNRRRPWHQALITERAAEFNLALGLEQSASDLLAETRRQYSAWCATGKVRQLDERYPFLASTVRRPGPQSSGRGPTLPGPSVSTDDIDLLAILRASQALSSETSPGRLRARLGEVLRAMTGATAVLMAERVDGTDDWLVFDTESSTGYAVPLSEAAAMLPVTALRYAQRTGEPVLISDPALDDRFARDPYLSGLETVPSSWCRSPTGARCGRSWCWRTGSDWVPSPRAGWTQ